MANPNTSNWPTSIATDTELPPWSNLVAGVLASDIDDSTLSIPLVSAAAFVNFPMVVTLDYLGDREEIFCVSKTTNTLNANSRGFGLTTAVAHSAGVSARCHFTARHLNQLYAEIIKVQAEIGPGLSTLHGILWGRYQFEYTGAVQTWTAVDTGWVHVALGGGGGGGAGSHGGGGGSAEVITLPIYVTKGDVYTIDLGAPGTGGGLGVNGGDGGASEFRLGSTVLIHCNGGKGGLTNDTSGASGTGSAGVATGRPTEQYGRCGAGGAGADFPTAINKGSGEQHQIFIPTIASGQFSGGAGGGNKYGIPGRPRNMAGGGPNGTAGTLGAGGAGSFLDTFGGNGSGGAGGKGFCIILT